MITCKYTDNPAESKKEAVPEKGNGNIACMRKIAADRPGRQERQDQMVELIYMTLPVT